MDTKDYVLIDHFCRHHRIENAFVDALQEYGLVEIVVIEEHRYLPKEQLKEIEKMMRFHYDLNINLEGIDVIARLLKRIEDLQHELRHARNKLSIYAD